MNNISYANEFNEILVALKNNSELKERIINLIQNKPILGKVLEETERVNEFKKILIELINENINSLDKSYLEVKSRLPRNSSKYYNDNRVFASGWEERLVRTHLSRFYNQAILEKLNEGGEEQCFVPSSNSSNLSSRCAIIQNQNYKVKDLLQNLINNYDLGKYDNSVKLPEHPHCSHVVKPLDK